MASAADPFASWVDALHERHLADLTFAEVRRALQALSSLYVERRGRLAGGAAFDGAGKRAAFALFYGPLHFLIVRAVVRELGAAHQAPRTIIDVGCGTGVGGAAWAIESGGSPPVRGIDANGWAVEEAGFTLRALGVRGGVRKGDALRFPSPAAGDALLASFVVNELSEAERERLLARVLEYAARGVAVLVVEPIARRPLPWWHAWGEAFRRSGGRDDIWRVPASLPERLAVLDRAAGLDHRTLTARTLFLRP